MTLLVSRCLLGESVRYDGGDRHESYVTEVLATSFTLVGICPEAEAGLGIPREPMGLEGDTLAPRVITLHTRRDLTDSLTGWSWQRVSTLAPMELAGAILKSRSPSCGVTGVHLTIPDGDATTSGVFVLALRRRLPFLPITTEEGLRDADQRAHWLAQVFVYRRWGEFLASPGASLVEFHRRHKYQIMAHDPAGLKALGRLAAQPVTTDLVERYGIGLMAAMEQPATPGRQVNALEHILGYFKEILSVEAKSEILAAIRAAGAGACPRSDPILLLQRWQARHPQPHLAGQWYLFPDPLEWRLRFPH